MTFGVFGGCMVDTLEVVADLQWKGESSIPVPPLPRPVVLTLEIACLTFGGCMVEFWRLHAETG